MHLIYSFKINLALRQFLSNIFTVMVVLKLNFALKPLQKSVRQTLSRKIYFTRKVHYTVLNEIKEHND